MFKYLIHPKLNNPAHPDFRKARIITVVFFLFIPILTAYDIFYFVKNPSDTVKNWTNIIGHMILFSSILFFRISGNFKWTLRVVACYGVMPTFVSIIFTGGLFSIDILWVYLALLGSYVFVDYKIGNVLTSITFIYYTCLALAYNHMDSFRLMNQEFILKFDFVHALFTIGIVFSLSALMLNVFSKNLEKANKKIDQMNASTIQDLQQLLKNKNEELSELRSSLAKDFHDEMGNKLASIRILADSLLVHHAEESKVKTKVETNLSAISERSKELFEGTKDFIWAIDPKSGDPEGLYTYLKEFGEKFFNDIQIDFISNFQSNNTQLLYLNPNVSRELIFIVKEWMTNAAKHSKTSWVEFKMELSDHQIVIHFNDAGVGFVGSSKNEGGLVNCKTRAEKIHAVHACISKLGQGTHLSLTYNLV